MTGRDTNVLKEVALEYTAAFYRYRHAMASGNTEKADAALAQMQQLERDVTVIRHNRGPACAT